MKKVDFLIAGIQKCGTTALHAYLRGHPQLFFDDETVAWGDGVDYGAYHAPFAGADVGRKWGEATPIYTYWPPSLQRIRAYNPGIKLIVLMRNPVERAYSHWNMLRKRGVEDLPFPDAVRLEQGRCARPLSQQQRDFSYVERGFYARQIERVFEQFAPGRLLALKTQDLRARPVDCLAAVCDFLGVDRFAAVSPRVEHVLDYESPMPPEVYNTLLSVYESDIRRLQVLLNWRCDDWLARKP
jgi:hypothetical protein